MSTDDFTPIDYPRIVLPDIDAPLMHPVPSGMKDIFDMPVCERVIRDVAGNASGGFTRTGTFLTLLRNQHYERVLYPGGIDDLPY